jgi:hypothetical protein
MGRLTRLLLGSAAALVLGAVGADAAAAFDGFGTPSADSTYGEQITFDITFEGSPPDRLELLLRTPEDEAAFVAPVDPGSGDATYVWVTSADHVVPNTPITYQWRAIVGDDVVLSEPATHRYEDDRPALDWQRRQLGEATVHWYGDAEAQALRFGEVTALGVERAEALLGTRLAGPVDVFVYATRDDFFGALGPGAREWTGAAAYSELRTIFMWLGGGSGGYLEQAMIHEVAHVVFHDATNNPYHEPARWLNEGVASWMEDFAGTEERSIVELEAGGGGLFSFDAITAQFPIGERGGRLSYAQGTTMIDLIVDRFGEEAIARIAAAYQEGASDAEALQAGTGLSADDLYAAFYEEFGVDPPAPIAAEPIAASNVDRPSAGTVDPGGVDGGPAEPTPDATPPDEAPAGDGDPAVPLGIGLLVAALLALGAAVYVSRRSSAGARS